MAVAVKTISVGKEATTLTGAGAAVSGATMAACCAHHVAELVPIVGISGAAEAKAATINW